MYVKNKGALLFFGVITSLASLAACGSRSEMVAAAASSGAGGSPSTSSGGGAMGAGGSQALCASLAITGDPITYDPAPDAHGARPTLVSTAADGSLASVVYSKQGLNDVDPGFFRVNSATFAPWGAWPTSLGPSAQATGLGGSTFVASAAMPEAQPGFSVLYYLPTNSFPSDMFMAPLVAPGITYDWSPLGLQWDSWEPAWPVAMARGASGHLAAYELGFSMNASLSVALVDAASQAVTVIDEIACANTPFPADVAPTTGGFLLATAAGASFGACAVDGIPGFPDEIQVIKIDAAAKKPALSAVVDVADQIAQIAVVKRSSGAWLVYHGAGANAEFPPPIAAISLDESGAALTPQITLNQETAAAIAFAAAPLGDALLLVWYAPADAPTLHMDLFDKAGAPLSHTSLPITGPLFKPSLSLLPSPDGGQALLAWSDITAPSPAAVRVARLACAPQP